MLYEVITDLLFEAGTVVTPAIVGVLASVNARRVQVYPRLRVAVMSTGDELVEDGRPLRPGEIRESNRRMLAGMLRETGCEVVDLVITSYSIHYTKLYEPPSRVAARGGGAKGPLSPPARSDIHLVTRGAGCAYTLRLVAGACRAPRNMMPCP